MKTLIILILLLSGCNKLNIDPFDIHTIEGFIAYSAAFHAKDIPQTPIDKSAGCKCNGTKKVKSGDGLLNVQCQCGPDCKCKTNNEGTGSIGTVNKLPSKYIVFITQENRCQPCRQQLSVFKQYGWIVTESPIEQFHVLKVEFNETVQEHYPEYDGSIPHCELIIDGKTVKSYSGFMNQHQLLEFWGN